MSHRRYGNNGNSQSQQRVCSSASSLLGTEYYPHDRLPPYFASACHDLHISSISADESDGIAPHSSDDYGGEGGKGVGGPPVTKLKRSSLDGDAGETSPSLLNRVTSIKSILNISNHSKDPSPVPNRSFSNQNLNIKKSNNVRISPIKALSSPLSSHNATLQRLRRSRDAEIDYVHVQIPSNRNFLSLRSSNHNPNGSSNHNVPNSNRVSNINYSHNSHPHLPFPLNHPSSRTDITTTNPPQTSSTQQEESERTSQNIHLHTSSNNQHDPNNHIPNHKDHHHYNNNNDNNHNPMVVTPTWRLKERMKTVGVGMILALNIGTDPPDVNKPTPCAKLQCWMDPSSISRAKARERIGERLEAQYAKWQQRAKLKYRRALDPTVEEVRSLCVTMRRGAKNERLLLHYNGHGVPRPTSKGEIWVFDRNHTKYIPLSVADLRKWIGRPSLVVLDCSCAGVLMPYFTSPLDNNGMATGEVEGESVGVGTIGNINASVNGMNGGNNDSNINIMKSSISVGDDESMIPPVPTTADNRNTSASGAPMEGESDVDFAARSVRDTIVLCPTAVNETLPLNPELPADLFTSCLTTPIPIALRWFVHQNPLSCNNLDPESVDLVPGILNDRKTPLGELNWIFTAITDTIAWNVLPSPLFQRLFRQDLLVASMFRNFLLADRILRDLNCTPSTNPALPNTYDHPLWQAWDLAVETCLSQLMREGIFDVSNNTNINNTTPNTGINRPLSNRNIENDGNEIIVHSSADLPHHDLTQIGPTANLRHGMVSRTNPIQMHHAHQDSYFGGNSTMTTSSSTTHSPLSPNRKKMNIPFSHSSHPPDSSSTASSMGAPFFAEQLTAFEIWLEYARIRTKEGGIILSPPKKSYQSSNRLYTMASYLYPNTSADLESPEQLPVVLQVLLSQSHRVRALILLRRFLDLGPSAVNLALSVGIFPYVLKLLHSSVDEYKHVLVGIWSKILEFDPSCQADLVKDGSLHHFIRHLHWGLKDKKKSDVSYENHATGTTKNIGHVSNTVFGIDDDASHQRTLAAVILSTICLEYPSGQAECIRKNLHGSCCALLESYNKREQEENEEKKSNIQNPIRKGNSNLSDISNLSTINHSVQDDIPSKFRMWLCICLGQLFKNNQMAQLEAFKMNVQEILLLRLKDDSPDVRASACFALGCAIKRESTPSSNNHASGNDSSDNTSQIHSSLDASRDSMINVNARENSVLTFSGGPMGSTSSNHVRPRGVPLNPSVIKPPIAATRGTGTNASLQPKAMGIGGLPWEHQSQQQQLQQQPQDYSNSKNHLISSLQPQLHNTSSLPNASLSNPLGPLAFVSAAPNHSSSDESRMNSHMSIQHQLPLHHHRTIPHQHEYSHHAYNNHSPHAVSTKEGRDNQSMRHSSIYLDSYSLNIDLTVIANGILEATTDASAVVRYEATMVLSTIVKKYFQAFATVADEIAMSMSGESEFNQMTKENSVATLLSLLTETSEKEENTNHITKDESSNSLDTEPLIPLPLGIDNSSVEQLRKIWKCLRLLQHIDPHPVVAQAATSIVSVVNDHILIVRTKYIQEKEAQIQKLKHVPAHNHLRFSGPMSDEITYAHNDAPLTTDLRHNQSDILNEGGWNARNGNKLSTVGERNESWGEMQYSNFPSHKTNGFNINYGLSRQTKTKSLNDLNQPRDETFKIKYLLPDSKFFEWKKSVFEKHENSISYGPNFSIPIDPLGPEGAILSYRQRRNSDVNKDKGTLTNFFSPLSPKSGLQPRRSVLGSLHSLDSSVHLLNDIEHEGSAERAAVLEAEVTVKKKALHFNQTSLVSNSNSKMTYMLRFHSYESALVSFDASDRITVWDTENAIKANHFHNGNTETSRLTSLVWLNEMNNTLLLTGCNDGSVKIWDGLLEGSGRISTEDPLLSSAFYAVPDLIPDQHGSGLVMDWQQCNGRLLASGNTNLIRCWDLETQKCSNILESNVDACLTTITTAWDGYGEKHATTSSLFSGIGPDVFIAGYGDGTLKIFDLRTNQSGVTNLSSPTQSNNTSGRLLSAMRRNRNMKLSEHTHWIVNTFFTQYGGRNEIVSGCVAGDLKFWDPRRQNSLRTVGVQRSPMTALACHPLIPLLATGSHAQFIKLLTPDGDTLQVIRYHEKNPGQRIGPVSCLAFHPNKPILAAGATDEIISLYSPKDKNKFY